MPEELTRKLDLNNELSGRVTACPPQRCWSSNRNGGEPPQLLGIPSHVRSVRKEALCNKSASGKFAHAFIAADPRRPSPRLTPR